MAKDSTRTTAAELQNIVESRVRKPLKKSPTSPNVVCEDFKKNYPSSSKTNSSIFMYQTRLERQMGLALFGSIKLVNYF